MTADASADPSADHGGAPEPDRHGIARADLVRIGLVSAGALASGLGLGRRGGFDLIALTATLAGGYPIYREAAEALASRRMTMELSMSLAIGAALVIRESFTAVVIVLFVLVAEVLEGLTVGRGRQALRRLVDLLPRTAVVRADGRDREVTTDQLVVGSVVIVKPGARLPVDGLVVSGHSFVDQATITGESMPVEKQEGAQVFAGTINQSGTLEVRATGIGHETAFGRIIEAVERAEKSRAPIQKTADRLAAYVVYFALGAALFTFVLTGNARATISVIIVAGACGIAAGTPLAILGAIGQAARAGAIVKGGLYVETLGRIDTVVLDKTGTVTFGNPEVVDVHPADGTSVEDLLEAAAMAERRSEHPLAGAVLRRAAAGGIAASDPDVFRYTPGQGIACLAGGEEILVGSRMLLRDRGVDIRTWPAPPREISEVLVARAGRFLGALHVADVLRPEAAQAVQTFRDMGLRTILLTGDAAGIAAAVAARLGVDEVGGELLPEEKLARIRQLLAEGRTVAMVGDGVNDAPALVQASVGIAMGSGTDVAMESAHVVLLGSDLLRLVDTVRVARRCRRIIRQNFVGTLVVDGIGVGLAALALLTPLSAAFIHVASELAFILNSARLLPSGAFAAGPPTEEAPKHSLPDLPAAARR